MNGIIGSFRIGEDVSVALDALTGDPATVTAITARMKPAKVAANRIILDDAATGIAMQVTPQGSTGWTISLANTATANLAVGVYGIDARLTIAGGVEMTEQSAFIALTKAAVA
jgi:hypothetical protein